MTSYLGNEEPRHNLLVASTVVSVPRVLAFGALAIVTMVIGYVGLAEYLPSRPQYGRGALDVLYYDIQLFFADADPIKSGGPYPPLLEVARFSGPLVTAYAVVEVVSALLTTQLHQVRARMAKGHIVVCGGGPEGVFLVQKLRDGGETVVVVAAGADQALAVGCRGTRIPVIIGDATDGTVLRRAGVPSASTVYAMTADSSVNTAIAVTARGLVTRPRDPLRCYALISDRQLRAALLARGFGALADDRFHLSLFCADEIGARALVAREPVAAKPDHNANAVIVGLGGFGRSLAVELVRRWDEQKALGAGRLRLVLVDGNAAAVTAHLRCEYVLLDSVCDIVPVVVDPAATHALENAPELRKLVLAAGDRVYVCCPDDTTSIKAGLGLVRLLADCRARIVVRTESRDGVLNEAFHGTAGRIFDDAQGTLHIFGSVGATYQPAMINDGVATEEIARSLHVAYIRERLMRGAALGVDGAMLPWTQISGELKQSNRALAHHIGVQLRSIGCIAVPSFDPTMLFSYRNDEVEKLARLEHARWLRDHRARGYLPGPRTEDGRHPDVVDWDELDEEAREKNRAFARALPGILAAAGLQIIRLPSSRQVIPLDQVPER